MLAAGPFLPGAQARPAWQLCAGSQSALTPTRSRPVQHKGGTNPVLRVRSAADGFPLPAAGSLGTDGSLDASSWGHMSNAVRWLGAALLCCWCWCKGQLQAGCKLTSNAE